MDAPGIGTIAAIGGGIVLGATFSALDAGLQAIGEVRLRAIATEGRGARARAATRAVQERARLQARWLSGRVVSLMVAGALAALVAAPAGELTAVLAVLGVALVYSLLAAVLATVMRQRAGTLVLRLLTLLRPLEWLLLPLSLPIEWVGAVVARLVPRRSEPDSERIAELAVEHVIEEGEEQGTIAEDQADLLRSVLEFKNTVAHEVMVPRTQTVAIDLDTPLERVIELIVESGHSRYPVYRGRIDQVEGVLCAKDIFSVLGRARRVRDVEIAQLIRKPVYFAAEAQKIGSLLRDMQARGVHLAIVVDEFGGMSGIVTLEDILEEIVGEIRDEHDTDEVKVEEIAPGRYLADADISVYDLSDILGESLTEEEGVYDSLGGLVIELAGKVPAVGESIRVGGFDLVVRQADERHVIRVELVKRTATEPPAPVEAAAQ